MASHLRLATTVFCLGLASGAAPQSIEELVSHYNEIFPSGNRNAASHLWSAFILKESQSYTPRQLEMLFRGFCPISGSPLPDEPRTRFHTRLADASTGEEFSGITHHCCWPCICDEQSYVKTDTKTVETANGPQKYRFLVIGDPCLHADALTSPFKDVFTGTRVTLQDEAPEVRCEDGKLAGAVFSDNGHPILGMFFDSDDLSLEYTEASKFDGQCKARQNQGYNSGMGAIFVKVANMTPLSRGTPLVGLAAISDVQSIEAPEKDLAKGRLLPMLALAAAAVGLVVLYVRRGYQRSLRSSEGASDPESIE